MVDEPSSPFDAYCHQALELMRWRLRQYVALGESPEPIEQLEQSQAAYLASVRQLEASGAELPERRLASLFGLGPVELNSLWLATLPWVDADARALIEEASGEPWISLRICITLFARSELERKVLWLCAQRSGAFRRLGLVQLVPRDNDPNPLRHELVPSADILGLFQGMRLMSAELEPYASWARPTLSREDLSGHGATVHDNVATILEGFWAAPTEPHPHFGPGGFAQSAGIAIVLQGPDGSGKTSTMKAAAATVGAAVMVVEGEHFRDLPRQDAARCLLAMLRESALFSELVIVRNADPLVSPEQGAAALLADGLARIPAVLVLCTSNDVSLHRSLEPCIIWKERMRPPAWRDEIAGLWRTQYHALLDAPEGTLEPDFALLHSRYTLSPLKIARAVRSASFLNQPNSAGLEQTSRNQVDTEVGELAISIAAERSLEDLVLDNDLLQRVIDIIEAARNRDRVLHEWKLAQSVRTGRGLCCLFSGEPGTGKTLCAEIIAHELGLELMRINTSQLFDKYIGETEKNLERIFQRARPSTHLLLFDEADALFSKRTEVKGSNDRYSNMNVGVLLQLVESYDGVVVLTTNLKHNIDRAFERRIMFKLVFPLPEAPERERLWRLLLPEDVVPTSEAVDYEALAELEISGGEIKNAVMHAAYAAARQGKLLDNKTLLDASYRAATESGRLIRDEASEPTW
jgi:AAA+ superfamily predicted ATPase